MIHPLSQRFAAIGLIAAAQAAHAGTETWFTPLNESSAVSAPNSLVETSRPWMTPEGVSQMNVVSLREVEDSVLSPLQSVVRIDAGRDSSMFGMIAYDPGGDYLFIPHGTSYGAGVSRYRIYENFCEVIQQGDQAGAGGDWRDDFGGFGGCRFTPNGTLLLAEGATGLGRVIEVLDPYAASTGIEYRVLDGIANVAHKGINLSKRHIDTLYYVDHDASGSIYKFVMTEPGDYTAGQTFVLKVDAYQGSAADDWNAGANAAATRVGEATWVALTDEAGVPLDGVTDPFTDTARAGRTAADDAGGTPYGHPGDIAISRMKGGREVLFFTAGSEAAVYSVEIRQPRGKKHGKRSSGRGPDAIVRVFASEAGTPKNDGFPGTTAVLDSPDNLAVDGYGNLYVIEDAPNDTGIGGDVWFARDTNDDGVAESLDHFMSLGVSGSTATGMIWNPVRRTEFAIAVQHPDSTDLDNVSGGLGDAVWLFDIGDAADEKFIRKLEGSKADFGE